VDEPNNTLLILATRQDYQRVLRIIETLDVVPNQVLIEATIAEVALTDDLKFGLRWHFQGKKTGFGFTGGDGFGSASRGSPTPWPRLTRRSRSMLSTRSRKST